MSDVSTAVDDGVEADEAYDTETSEAAASASEDSGSVEEETPEDETETDQADGDGETEEDEEEAEEVEIDFGGNKLTLKKGDVPDEVLAKVQDFTKDTWAAATKRNQEIAEQRKALEAKEKVVERLSTLEGEALAAFSRGQAIQNELAQLDQTEIDRLWQSQHPQDQDRARRMSDRRAKLERDFHQTVATVDRHERERTATQEAEVSRLMDEGRARADTMVKGFSEKAPEVEKYVVEKYGLTPDEAKTWPLNPTTAIMAYKAMQYDKMQEARAKPAPKKPTDKPVTPMKNTGGVKKGPRDLVKDAEKMSADEWARERNRQLAARR